MKTPAHALSLKSAATTTLVLTASLFSLAACEKKSDSGPAPAPAAVGQQAPAQPNEESVFRYQYVENGCDTGEHRSNSKAELCAQLKDNSLNHGCAEFLRRIDFEQSAGCGAWPTLSAPPMPGSAAPAPAAPGSSAPQPPAPAPAPAPSLSPSPSPVATPVNAGDDCLEAAFDAYDKQYQSGTAMDKAVAVCKTLLASDVERLKWSFNGYQQQFQQGTAMDKAAVAAIALRALPLELLQFVFGAYEQQYQGGMAMDKTVASAQKLRPDVLARLKVLFEAYERQYQAGTAMDKAIASL